MIRRTSCIVVLAAAVAAVGCSQPNQGPTGAVSFDQKVKRVEAMTRALSLSSNAGLKKAGESMSAVNQTMSQGAFAKTAGAATNMVAAGAGNIVSAGAGNMVSAGAGNFSAPSTGYVIQALVEDLEAAARDDMYRLQGTMEADGATWEIDDTTGDVTGVSTADASATFSQVATGTTRSCTMKLTKSKDGTTGTIKVEISADTWKPKPEEDEAEGSDEGQDDFPLPSKPIAAKATPRPIAAMPAVPAPRPTAAMPLAPTMPIGTSPAMPVQPATPAPTPTPTPKPTPLPVPIGDEEEEQLGDEELAEGELEAGDEGEADGEVVEGEGEIVEAGGANYRLRQAAAAPKFKLFNDEVPDPDSITKLKVTVDLKAQGKASLPLKVALELAGFQALGGKHTPTKLGLDFTVADLVFNSDTTLGEGTIKSSGGMKIPTDEGQESFKYAASLNMPKSTASFDLTNEGAKVRFGMKMAPKGGKPDFSSGLYATEDGTKLADLDFSTAASGHATIKFTNGKSVKWNLTGDTPIGFPGAAPLGAPKR